MTETFEATPALAGTVQRNGVDPITFEVVRNGLSGVVDEMAVMLENVAFSTVVSEGRDFSGAICAANGDLVAQGDQDIPFIGGTVPFRVKALIGLVPREELRPRDVLLLNDPFLGGTHAQDVSAIMPIFWEGELVAFVQTAAHYPDMGGAAPGSFNPEAESSYAEALLLPPIHIVREGRLDTEVERLILRNVRVPEIIRGDLRGTIEACRAGEQRLHALFRKYGVDVVLAVMEGVLSAAGDLLKAEFARLPDGRYSWTDRMDRDRIGSTTSPIVGLDLTIERGQVTYDFSRSAPQAPSPVNIPTSALYAAVATATKHVFPDVPFNQGLIDGLNLVIPSRSVVSAEHPAPVSGGAAGAAEKVISCVHGCFIQFVPERCMACPTNLTNMCLSGFDPRPGWERDYVMYLWLAGGWGARPGKKDNHTFVMPLAGGTRTQPAEVLERRYPVLIEGYGLIPDSEGAGKHRGGFGLSWPVRLTHAPGTISVQGDRELYPNWGYAGGQPAQGNHLVYAPGTDEEQNVGIMRANFPVEPGRLLDYSQGGGGGFGEPHERPVEWVLEDVMNGLVSLERARSVYGVAIRVLDEDRLEYEIDVEDTARLRAGREASPE